MKNDNPTFVITAEIYDQVYEFIGRYPAERGIMIGRSSDGVIRYYEPDMTGDCNAVAYDPDIDHMNSIIKQWKAENIEFIGFIHSHPSGIRQPSSHDHWYAGEILACFKKLEKMWMPIAQTIPDTGKFELIPYAVFPSAHDRKNCKVVACPLKIIGVSKYENYSIKTAELSSSTVYNDVMAKCKWFGVQQDIGKKYSFKYSKSDACMTQSLRQNLKDKFRKPNTFSNAKAKWEKANTMHDAFFQRLSDHYDLMHLDKIRLVIVGTGGASSFVRNCARMGFGEYVLIDPDVISKSNIGTQDAMPSAIGRTKVEVLAEDIVEINPRASVAAFPVKIDDFTDASFSKLLSNPIRWEFNSTISKEAEDWLSKQAITPKKTILLVLTDNFEAQARGHRLGLNFGISTICAQEYVEGIGAEVTYTVPGVTPACHRCITASRYKAYLEEGFKNDVTSLGASVFAAEFLNAVLGHVLLAVAHHETGHSRWGHVIRDLGNRNLLRIRMDNSFDMRFGKPVFGSHIEGVKDKNVFHSLDTLFLPQNPDFGQSESRPVCPDCGGQGDLSILKGRLGDTLKMRK